MVPIKKLFYFRLKLFPSRPLHKSCRYLSELKPDDKSASITLDEIKALIPKKIERGPTDILKALSETCKRDYTAYHYKFMDDPYFYPLTNITKRNNSLCLESGRKAAKWIVKEYPQLFDHKISEPFIQALAPPIVYDENSDVTEKTLLGIIAGRNVSDAIYVYSLLKQKNVEVSNDTKQLLLELVCFYNCEKLVDESDYETNWFQDDNVKHEGKTWKDKGFAEELFREMNLDCSLAYSTLIQGMLKYRQIDEANNLIKVAKEKNLKLAIGVYNELIKNSNRICQSGEAVWEYIIELLREINKNELMPNIYTLNAILKVLKETILSTKRERTDLILKEFANIGIKPSLGSRYYAMHIMCSHKERNYHSHIYLSKTINSILNMKKWDIQHPDDTKFFHTAMAFCEKYADVELAQILIRLVEENNENLFGRFINEYAFYRSYFTLILKVEPIEHVIEIYKKFVPTVTSAEEWFYQKLLEVIKENEAFQFLPFIWNDITNFFNIGKQHKLGEMVLDMSKKWDGKGEVAAVFKEVAEIFLSKLNSVDQFESISDQAISNLIITCLTLDDFDAALLLITDAAKKTFVGLDYEAVLHFYNYCLKKNFIDHLLTCLEVAGKVDHPQIKNMATEILTRLEKNHERYGWVKDLAEKKYNEG